MIAEGKVDPTKDNIAAKAQKVVDVVDSPAVKQPERPVTYDQTVEAIRSRYTGKPVGEAFEDIMSNRTATGGDRSFTPEYISALNDSKLFPYKFEVKSYDEGQQMTWGVARPLKGFSKDPKMGGGYYHRKWYADGTYDELDPQEYADQLETYRLMPENVRKTYKEYMTPETFDKERSNPQMAAFNQARREEYVNQYANQFKDSYNRSAVIPTKGI